MTRTIWQRWNDLCLRMKEKVSPSPKPAPDEPNFVSTFRLSKEEVQMFEILVTLEVKAAMNISLALEWSEYLRLGDQYPFRTFDPSLVTSISIREWFTTSDAWRVVDIHRKEGEG